MNPAMNHQHEPLVQHLAHFAEALRGEEASELTVKNYLLDLTHFGRWFAITNGEPLALAAITPTDVKGYRAYLLTVARARPATINRRLAALRKLCRWAKAKGLIQDDPTQGIKGAEKVKTAPRALDKKELYALIRAVERHGDKRDLAIIQVLRHTGLRVGELAALCLSDVTLSERKGTLTVRTGKGGKWREVPLNNDARRALRAYLAVRPQVGDDHLFIGQRGKITAAGIQDVVAKYARLANLVEVSPHVLRHTFGKSLLDQGVNLVTVASLLGHSRLDTTAIYTQPSQADQEKAVETIAESET
jgi:integrase/recombinase XerC